MTTNKLMALNLLFFALGALGSNLAAIPIDGFTVKVQTIINDYPLSIQPAGWAFSIWGIIYLLLAGFAVYQAIPTKYFGQVVYKNEELVFKDIKTLWIINMSVHTFWNLIFLTNSGAGFYLALIDIIVMLVTGYKLMAASMRNSVNWIEFITMRIGFSIYSAWLVAATILNITFVLKWTIKGDPKTGFWENEEAYGIVVVWLAFLLYNFVSYYDKNPVFGLIYLWVLAAIMSDIEAKRPQMEALNTNCLIVMIIHSISMLALTMWLLFKLFKPDSTKKQSHGIFFGLNAMPRDTFKKPVNQQ